MKPANKIKLAICDDHKIFRNGVVSSLRPYNNIEVIYEAENGADLLGKIKELPPDVVLLDINMPEMDGLEVCKLVKKDYPKVNVIGLSLHEEVYFISGMFKAGAGSYLLKDVDPEEMVNVIQKVYNDKYYIHSTIPMNLVKNLIKIDHPLVAYNHDANDDLKEKEIEMLRLIASEHTNKEIAVLMKLSPVTIENYRNQLLKKTGARNTAGLVTYAVRKGFIIL